jgi:hypothetical protein
MISTDFRQKFKKNLGENFRYVSKVQLLLEASEVFSSKSKPYSNGYIQNVFLGYHENQDIELAIHQVYDSQMKIKEKLFKIKSKHGCRVKIPNQLNLIDSIEEITKNDN